MCKVAYCEYLWILECKIRFSVCNFWKGNGTNAVAAFYMNLYLTFSDLGV